MRLWWWSAVLLLLFGVAFVHGREPSFQERGTLYDSLAQVHPRMRAKWLTEREIDLPESYESRAPESTGLRLVGKYGRGPSYEVTGRDSLVFLSLGSEVAIINFSNPDSPRVISELQASGLAVQAAVRDSLLYVGVSTGAAGLEVWNVADPALPVFRGRVLTRLSDFCIRDSFAYVTSRTSSPSNDTFKVYNLADPDNLTLTGWCRDSGDAVTVAGNTAVLGDWDNLFTIDVSDPAHPHRVGSYPGWAISVAARGNICCATLGNPNEPDWLRFMMLDIRNPSAPVALSSVDNCGGYDIYLDDSLAFLSGYYTGGHEFCIMDIADSTAPSLVGTCATPGDNWGVWARLPDRLAYVADRLKGLAVIDLASLSAPRLDTGILAAGLSYDISIDGQIAGVAEGGYGMGVLDVSDPSRPVQLGGVDSQPPIETHSVAIRDSFAYMGFWPSLQDLRVIDISNPSRPVSAGGVNVYNRPEDMVLRDSFLYIAEANRFQVVNVARPREPVLVGSCVTSTYSGYDLAVAGTFAYVAGLPLLVVSLAQPDSPFVAGEFGGGVWGLDAVDTVLYAVGQNAQFWTLSVANPASPRLLDSIRLPSYDGEDVAVVGTKAYVSEVAIRILDVSNPGDLRLIGQASVPQWTPRLVYAAPYLYACCAEGGVCVFETLPTGIEERIDAGQQNGLTIRPSVTDGRLVIRGQVLCEDPKLAVFDVSGREVMRATMPAQRDGESGRWLVDLSRLSSGVYVLRLEGKGVNAIGKVVINRR